MIEGDRCGSFELDGLGLSRERAGAVVGLELRMFTF